MDVSKRPGDPGHAGRWCIYFRSIHEHETCEAGIRYDSHHPARRPCFLDRGRSKPDSDYCEKLRRPTPDDISAHDLWVHDRMTQMGRAQEALWDWRRAARKGKAKMSTIVDCPCCDGGKLSAVMSRGNDHVQAHCSTPGCVSWIE